MTILKTDARVIAATKVDLQQAVSQWPVSAMTVFYRLVCRSSRKSAAARAEEDILLLVQHFVQRRIGDGDLDSTALLESIPFRATFVS